MSDVDNVGESDLTSTSSDHEFPVAILPINRALPTFLRPGIYQQFLLTTTALLLMLQLQLNQAALKFEVKQHCNAKSSRGHLTQPDLILPDLLT